MPTVNMKEFDKIYIAKYCDKIGVWQTSKDLNVKKEELDMIVNELKDNGLYAIYKSINDYEWDELSNKSDQEILSIYLPKIKEYNIKVINKIIEEFKEDLIEEIHKFKVYNPNKNKFNFDYFCEKNFKDEEWKKISNLNYEISNYGRIKNVKTKKIKALKHQKFGMQVILWQNSKSYTITISRLVATMFIRKVEKDERVTHVNGNIRDNYYKNLKIIKKIKKNKEDR